jgi:ABC-type nitrate/sulfonate/bicarbonate transport system substrate-binding protein
LTRRRAPRAAVVAVAVVVAAALAGCGAKSSAAGREVTELRYQGSVGQVTLPELAEDLGYLGGLKLKWIGNTISGPQDIQAATTGDVDFGGAFNGAIVKLVAAKAPVRAVIGYYGSNEQVFQGFYVLDGSPIRSPRDLIGKRIGVNTLGAHAEAVIKTYLSRNGLTDAEIKQVQLVVVPPANTEQSLRARQIDVAQLSGILRDKALERGGLRTIFTDYELLGTFTGGSYLFRTDFIKRNADTVRAFVTGVAKAIEWTKAQPREVVIARFEEILRKRGRNEDASALKFWRSYGVAGTGGLITDKEFSTWVDWLTREGELNGKHIEVGQLYTNEFNPFRDGGPAR